MMRIALFHNLPEGGAKIAMHEHVKRLKDTHTVHLFSLISQEGEYDVRPFCEKIFLFPYEVVKRKLHGLSRISADVKVFTLLRGIHREIAKEIQKGEYDLVFVHPDRLTQAPYLLRYLKTPSAYYCQEPLRIAYEYGLRLKEKVGPIKQMYEKANRAIRKSIDRTNARAATRILSGSHYVLEYISKAYGVKASWSPLGVDVDVFRPIQEQRRNGVLFIGKPCPEDGYDLVLEAMGRIKTKPTPKLTIVKPTQTRLKRTRAEVVRAYNNAQVTVCATVLEPFGLVPLESMACETPVVAVDEGGYRETVVDGKTGFLVDRDPVDLAEKLAILLTDQNLAGTMGKVGRTHVQENWTWEKSLSLLEENFNRIAKSKR